MEILGGIVVAVVFTVGLTELIRVLRFWLLKPLDYPPIVVELLLDNEDECEYQLRAVLERIRWLKVPNTLRVRCINVSGSRTIDMIVHRFAARHRCIEYGRTGYDEPFSRGTEKNGG